MWSIIVHGGAKEIEAGKEEANRKGCLRALEAGKTVLKEGGSAVQAVEAAVRVMEDDPTFNAGYGSVLNEDNQIEMSASCMEGAHFQVGAVAGLQAVRHAVSVARMLLPEGPILLIGEGAQRFAEEHGAELCEMEDLISVEQWEKGTSDRSRDTVGAVALDKSGDLAVATSTGGIEGAPLGRVGDSPQPGCGFYAENGIGAVAYSGDGEQIARMMLAARTLQLMENREPQKALETVLKKLDPLEGEGGGIAISPDGKIGWAHSSSHFAVAFATSEDEENKVYLQREEVQEGR